MNINLNFKELVRQYVAPHRRQKNRLKWLWALVDLDIIWNSFAQWRYDYRYKIQITSQHLSLQGHLNKVFGGGIIIKSYDDKFLEIGLNQEKAHWVLFSPMQEIALKGESSQSFADVDFIVYAPNNVNIEILKSEIEKYKLADKAYKIIS